MTVLVSTHVPEGIVMGADSRLTTSLDKGGTVEKYTSSDNVTKIFLLKKIPLGISLSGNSYHSVPSQIIDEFERDVLTDDDTIESAPLKFMSFLQKTFPVASIRIQMCGYQDRVPYVYLVDKFTCERFNCKDGDNVSYNVLWSGHAEAIANLLLGEHPTTIDFQLMPIRDAVDFTEFLIDLVIKRDRFNEGLSTCGGPIDILVLTPEEQFFYRHKLLKP